MAQTTTLTASEYAGTIGGAPQTIPGLVEWYAAGFEPAREALRRASYERIVKRAIDVAVATVALIVLLPMLCGIAAVIRVTTHGPAIFRQRRLGRGGRVFTVHKFRTMIHRDELLQAELPNGLGFTPKTVDDPRVTKVGRLLRRTSLDELPQLFNVIKGDMSIVGPRPVTPCESITTAGFPTRLLVAPGMTGLWQVSGRSSLSAEDRSRLDQTYVQNWSLLLDISIILRTIPAVTRQHETS